MVLFSAMFSCFLLDSFELEEMVCFTKHGATFSSARGELNARVMMNISEIDSHHICKRRPSCDRERGPGDLSPQARW